MKILIVDDEIIIRNGLSTVINWQQLGFTLLEPAESAEEALERIPAERPDLLLTDIRMGGKDGITLVKEARELLPDLEAVLLTGYDDFAYMQQAIRHEVSDYLLKTSRPEDIIQAVIRAAKKVQDKREAASKVVLKDKEVRDHWFIKMLESGITPDLLSLQAYMPLLGSTLDELRPERLQVVVIQAEGWGEKPSSALLLHFAVENMLRELISCETLVMNGRVAAVVRADAAWGQEDCDGRSLLEQIEHLLKCALRCAAGVPVAAVEELHQSYRTAQQAAAYWELTREKLVAYERVCTRKGWNTLLTRYEETELGHILSGGNSLQLSQWIYAAVQAQMEHPETTYESYSSYVHSVALSGLRWLERLLAETPSAQETIHRFSVFGSEGHGLLRDQLQTYLQSVMAAYHRLVVKGQSAYVQRAITYVKEHVGSQRIGLSDVARHVHLHHGHLSEVFKKETGMTFGDFVTREKLERAKEMLLDPAVKISEVARAVGYEDVKYFSQLFKKHFTQIPSEYREVVSAKKLE
ncbi:response regulator transcription factor [Paenibacillus thalictri]|uniref:Response regulator n=1 Tax=Paenibacillus thalictri TaxID=2527873 RepID=A0A4Q9DJC1_9BACL|nr:helix-turn-helix domain-containing protein [Paenibacillus thalictri]TBL71450.1 response regulator [Paenibacillus thalictri]